jgi:hypothetical protein
MLGMYALLQTKLCFAEYISKKGSPQTEDNQEDINCYKEYLLGWQIVGKITGQLILLHLNTLYIDECLFVTKIKLLAGGEIAYKRAKNVAIDL